MGKSLLQQVAQGVPGRLRPRTFMKFRHYKGDSSSAKRTGRLYPSRNPWYSLSEAESTSGHMVLSGEPRKKSPVTPPGIDPGTVRLVAQCLNHYAAPGPLSRNSSRGNHRWRSTKSESGETITAWELTNFSCKHAETKACLSTEKASSKQRWYS